MILVLRKMGRGSQILHIIFISIFMLISLQSTHILVVNALLNAVEHYNGQNTQQLQYLEDFKERKEKYLIEQVAGEDDDGEAKALIWEKFRALLGLDDFNGKNPAKINKGYGSASPSPLPSIDAEAPAPAPMVPIHVHSHHPLHHSHPKKPLQKMHKEDKDKGGKRIMVAVLTSVGATFVLFSIGLICVCRIFRKQRKRSAITILTSRTGGRNRGGSLKMSSQNSGKKVSSNPGLDQFYLESIETALKPQAFSLKQNSEVVKISSVESTSICKLNEIEESEEAMKISDSQDIDSDGEIMSFRENAESVNNESDRFNSLAGNKLSDELHSSDDESFHSFCDSHSSSTKLSNASAEILSPKGFSPNSVTSPTNQIVESVSSSKTNSKMKLAAPPPPPPLPPPPQSHISPSPSSSCSTPFKYKALSSSTLPLSSSPTNSNSSSGSNQTPQHELPPKPSGTIPGIPPPPCPPSQLTRLGKDGVPLPKLKPLHWDKVRAAPDRSMVWDNLRSNSFEFDEEMIESLFGYNLQSSLKSDEAKSKSKSPSPSKHLLEPKRVQNITILSKAVNVTAEQVCEALVQGEGLCLQQLEALAKMVPTNEEEVKLSNYKGGINGLSSAETFVKAILNIPFAFSRIEAMLYRETFEDEVVHLRKSFSMLEEACKELKSSRLFLKLLEAVLKTGNRMNIGTMRGGARAFKLDALLKLADVKGTDGRTTLLHFVVQEIVRSEGIRVSESIMGKINLKTKSSNVNEREENCRNMGLDLVSGLSIELCNVKKTATIDLDVLASSVSNLSDGMLKLKLLLGKELFSDEKSGNSVYSMRSFLVYAEKKIKELQEDEGRVLLRVREITEYFHGNVSKDEANPLRIFVIVRDFLGMLDHVCKELRSSKVPSSSSPLAPFR